MASFHRLLRDVPKHESFFRKYLSSTVPSSTPSLQYLIHSLPWQYLRAADSSNFDPATYQRVDVQYDFDSGKPTVSCTSDVKIPSPIFIESAQIEGDSCKVQWSDGRLSAYSIDWLQEEVDKFHGTGRTERTYWQDMSEERVRESSSLSMDFEDVISDEGMERAIRSIYRYGILLVKNTPVAGTAGVAALGSAISGGSIKDNPTTSLLASFRQGGSSSILEHGTDGPMRTLYGSVWSTSSASQEDGTSKADSAYGSDGLPLHTDMTYMRDPPGLQIFTMVQPATRGGQSVFGDGFAVADKLRTISPTAFAVLSRTNRRYRCVDKETGWNLQATGPLISVRNGEIAAIRHNDLDRLPDLPPVGVTEVENIDAFYSSLEVAHKEWDQLLAQDEFRLIMELGPGDTMVVANQVRRKSSISGHTVYHMQNTDIVGSLYSSVASMVVMDFRHR